MEFTDGMMPLTITVVPADSPMEPRGDDSLVLEIGLPGGIDGDTLHADLIAMTGLTDGFVIEERRTTTEWGASAYGIEIALTVMSVAWEGIVGGAAWAGLMDIAERCKGKTPVEAYPPQTDAEVQWEAKQRVVRRYYDHVSEDDLTVVKTTIKTSHDGVDTRVELSSRSGETYIVTSRSNGDMSMTRVEQAPTSS